MKLLLAPVTNCEKKKQPISSAMPPTTIPNSPRDRSKMLLNQHPVKLSFCVEKMAPQSCLRATSSTCSPHSRFTPRLDIVDPIIHCLVTHHGIFRSGIISVHLPRLGAIVRLWRCNIVGCSFFCGSPRIKPTAFLIFGRTLSSSSSGGWAPVLPEWSVIPPSSRRLRPLAQPEGGVPR